eukprot:5946317-Pyramimonas_sp.AAC.1
MRAQLLRQPSRARLALPRAVHGCGTRRLPLPHLLRLGPGCPSIAQDWLSGSLRAMGAPQGLQDALK